MPENDGAAQGPTVAAGPPGPPVAYPAPPAGYPAPPGGYPPQSMAAYYFGPPIPDDAPYEPLAIAALVSGLLFMPFAWVLAIFGASRAARLRRKGRVMAVIGGWMAGS